MTSKTHTQKVLVQKLGYMLRCLAPLGIVITLLSSRIIYLKTYYTHSTIFLSEMLQLLMDQRRKNHIPSL